MIEDKAAAFDAVDSLDVVLPAMTGLVRTMKVRAEVLRRQSTEGFTLATEIADWLSRQGVPFATAHEITGAVVRFCEERGTGFESLSAADLKAIDARLDGAVLKAPDAGGGGRRAPRPWRDGAGARARAAWPLAQSRAAQRGWCEGYGGPRPATR